MSNSDLSSCLYDFEAIAAIQLSERNKRPVARAILEVHLTRNALSLLELVKEIFPTLAPPPHGEREAPSDKDKQFGATLLDSIAYHDQAQTERQLDRMGVFAHGCLPEVQLDRLQVMAGCVIGPSRLVPLVELAFLAAQLNAFGRASDYVRQALTLRPRAYDMHVLQTVQGLACLNTGDVRGATVCLGEARRACHCTEVARLDCKTRSPILMLAEQLLIRGETRAVLRYLEECRVVWNYPTSPIPSWIEAIRRGECPIFTSKGGLSNLEDVRFKVPLQIAIAEFIDLSPELEIAWQDLQPSTDGVLEALQRDAENGINGKLDRSNN